MDNLVNFNYLAMRVESCHGDENQHECFGDPDIWCTCMEDIEQARERMEELHFDSLRL